MDLLKTESYDYYLPEELIAQKPADKRDNSRLLVYNRADKSIQHKVFHDIIDYLKEGDVLVVNNTKVIPARLYGTKRETNAKMEILLLKRLNLTDWEVLIKPGKRAKIGSIIDISPELSLNVVSDTDFGGKVVSFKFDGVFENILDKVGVMPLPPYIKAQPNKFKERYNTVYAKVDGSAAAPTAGLHFTTELMDKLKAKGVIVANVLLHVGLGTFRPVSEDDILKHDMHTEYYEVSEETAEILNKAKREGRRIIAVGTTSVRTLESATDENGVIKAQHNTTNIFIYPGYKFKMVDALITNFHLPKSTLIMLVSAFIGRDETIRMYEEAVREKYHFFSFGDATFLY